MRAPKVVIACSKSIYFVSAPKPSDEIKTSSLKVVKSIEPPSVLATPSGTSCTFRAARCALAPPLDTDVRIVGDACGFRLITTKEKDDTRPTVLYTVVNTTPPRSAGKGIPRSAYVCTYQLSVTDDGEVLATLGKTKSVSRKAVTVFDVRWVCCGFTVERGSDVQFDERAVGMDTFSRLDLRI